MPIQTHKSVYHPNTTVHGYAHERQKRKFWEDEEGMDEGGEEFEWDEAPKIGFFKETKSGFQKDLLKQSVEY